MTAPLSEEDIAAALAPFARVVAALDYWSPLAMPDWGYPVLGTNLTLARDDCPEAVGGLNERDFREAARVLSILKRGKELAQGKGS